MCGVLEQYFYFYIFFILSFEFFMLFFFNMTYTFKTVTETMQFLLKNSNNKIGRGIF